MKMYRSEPRDGEARCGKRLVTVALAALLLAVIGCPATTGTRAGPGGKGVPEERYSKGSDLVGTGCVATTGDVAQDRISADELARAEVAKQIEVKVIQQVDSMQREEMHGEQALSTSSVSIQTREMVDRTLKGVKIVDRYTNDREGMTCAVAVLNKAALANRIREELDRILQETSSYLASAQRAEQQGQGAEALRGYALALMNLVPARVEVGLLRDLGYGPPPLPSRVDIWKKFMRVLEGIEILPTGGNLQKARPGSPLANALEVKVVQENRYPVANLPLKVLRSPDRIDMQKQGRTGETGQAEFLVFDVPRGRQSLQEIAIGLDWEALAQKTGDSGEDRPWQAWDVREAVFTYNLPVPDDYRVGVAVYDSRTGKAMVGSSVQAALLESLQRVGFQTRNVFTLSGTIRKAFAYKPSVKEAQRVLQGKVDILVVGNFRQGAPKRSSHDFIFCRTQLLVQGILLSSGRTLMTVDVTSKGGGLDNDRANRKAVEGLGKKLRTEVGPKLAGSL